MVKLCKKKFHFICTLTVVGVVHYRSKGLFRSLCTAFLDGRLDLECLSSLSIFSLCPQRKISAVVPRRGVILDPQLCKKFSGMGHVYLTF